MFAIEFIIAIVGNKVKRSYKDVMGMMGSDGYLYDFTKRSSAKDYMGAFGSDGYLYDFAKASKCSYFMFKIHKTNEL